MKSNVRLASLAVLAAATLLGGCDGASDFFKTDKTRWIDPSSCFRQPECPMINPIRNAISVVDVTQELPPAATVPGPDDWTFRATDYLIGARDIVDVTILDLYTEGVESIFRRQVSESGFIDLPLIGRVKAEKLTQDQLVEAIRDAYSPDILRDPTVSVTITQRRQSMFSIMGAVARTGTYEIVRPDMRLIEAIAMAGGKTQTNIPYVLIIRQAPPQRVEDQQQAQPQPNQQPAEPAAAPAQAPTAPSPVAPAPPAGQQPPVVPPAATQPGTAPGGDEVDDALRELWRSLDTQPSSVVIRGAETDATPAAAPAVGDPDLQAPPNTGPFIYSGNRWVRVQQPQAQTATNPADAQELAQELVSDPFGWRRAERTGGSRIIAVNMAKLEAGDPAMNIVIRDSDTIVIPILEPGEFYVMGEVLRPGVYSLTGRAITIKMALAAAGNLAPLAWPENSILVRRVGQNQETMVPIDIEAIFRGEASDIYLKPNDVIAVGTDVRAPFYAVMRNAFRMTYGFGFIYDRNFAEPLLVTPNSRRFLAL